MVAGGGDEAGGVDRVDGDAMRVQRGADAQRNVRFGKRLAGAVVAQDDVAQRGVVDPRAGNDPHMQLVERDRRGVVDAEQEIVAPFAAAQVEAVLEFEDLLGAQHHGGDEGDDGGEEEQAAEDLRGGDGFVEPGHRHGALRVAAGEGHEFEEGALEAGQEGPLGQPRQIPPAEVFERAGAVVEQREAADHGGGEQHDQRQKMPQRLFGPEIEEEVA